MKHYTALFLAIFFFDYSSLVLPPNRVVEPIRVSLGEKVCTTYHAVTAECDRSPDIGAGGRVAVAGNPTGKWCASNELPFGTKLVIPAISGQTIWTVRDRLHRRFSHRIDLLMPLSVEGFGLKRAEVFIVKEGRGKE